MRAPRPLLLLPPLVLACACTAPQPLLLGDPDAAAVADAIDLQWREHIAAAQRNDLDAVVDLYAEDAIYVIPGEPAVRGRAALRRMEERGLAQGRVVAARHRGEALRVYGNLAHELGSVVGTVQPADQEPQHVAFHYAATWQLQEDGRWRILTITGR